MITQEDNDDNDKVGVAGNKQKCVNSLLVLQTFTTARKSGNILLTCLDTCFCGIIEKSDV